MRKIEATVTTTCFILGMLALVIVINVIGCITIDTVSAYITSMLQ